MIQPPAFLSSLPFLSTGAVEVVWIALTGFLLFNIVLMIVMILTYMERKVGSRMQIRMGPTEFGPGGILIMLADAIKLLTKQDITPRHADKFVFRIAPVLIVLPALIGFSLIPFTTNIHFADFNIGLLILFALTSMTSMAILMAGWGSNNKYSLLGAARSAAQDLSYEVALIFSALGVLVLAGTMSLRGIVDEQIAGTWYIFLQPLAFILFFIAGVAELNRTPFDLPESESEIVAGYFTEYSGMRFSLFFLAEYANMILMSSLITVLFLGGWAAPFGLTFIPPLAWFILKVFSLIFVMIWIRFTFPRFRVDQLMGLGWKVLVPLALANVLVTAFIVLLGVL